MVTMMLMTRRKDIMDDFVLPPALTLLGWIATAVMLATVIALAITYFV